MPCPRFVALFTAGAAAFGGIDSTGAFETIVVVVVLVFVLVNPVD
jgi:hypothetical protein